MYFSTISHKSVSRDTDLEDFIIILMLLTIFKCYYQEKIRKNKTLTFKSNYIARPRAKKKGKKRKARLPVYLVLKKTLFLRI
jgi:uncharacterized membrane protein